MPIFLGFLRVGGSRQLMLVENYNIIEVMHPKIVAVGDVIWRYLKNQNSPQTALGLLHDKITSQPDICRSRKENVTIAQNLL